MPFRQCYSVIIIMYIQIQIQIHLLVHDIKLGNFVSIGIS